MDATVNSIKKVLGREKFICSKTFWLNLNHLEKPDLLSFLKARSSGHTL